MKNNLKNQIALMVMILVILEGLGGIEKKEEHPIENQSPQDTSLRIHLTDSTPITGSPAADSKYIRIIQNFMSKQ